MKTKFLKLLGALLLISNTNPSQTQTDYLEIFRSIEDGINNSRVDYFSGYFGKQIYISLSGNEDGIFSATQAYYVLQNYLNKSKILSFRFNSYGTAEKKPFAVGNATFRTKGSKVSVQVYVSLNLIDDKWVIDKLNFY